MTEYTVHNECDTYHVATVFKDRQEQEQDCHLRNESKYCTETTDDAINYKSHYHVTCTDAGKDICKEVLNSYYEYIVCPVCYECTNSCNRYIIYKPHDCNEDRDAEDTVGNDAVDLIRYSQFVFCFFNGCVNDLLDEFVSLVCYDTLHVIVMFFLKILTFAVYQRLSGSRKLHSFFYFFVVLEEFYCIPSLLVFCDGGRKNFLYFTDCFFHLFCKDFFRKICTALLCSFYCFVDQLVKTFTFQCRCLNDRAVKQHGKALGVDLDSSFFKKICHVQCDNNRNACLDQLCGQIQVTLDVCCVDKINDYVWIFFENIVTADYLFQCVW